PPRRSSDLIGEGGSNIELAFARVFAYSAKKLLSTPASSTCPMTGTTLTDAGSDDQDFGMSPGTHVSDFISNTGVHVVSIATNFNGLTNLVRAGTDSTYYLDEGLRLWGTSSVGSATPGMDMNYNHNFEPGPSCTVNCGGGSGNIAERMVFAASPDTSIRVFDTFFFNQQRKISIRDPIIGPLRVAFDATSGQQYLFGMTTRGRGLVAVLEGIPAGLPLSAERINVELKRRMGGYGRGARMKIEADQIEWLAGVRAGETLGSPIAMLVWNRDWEHWQDVMAPEADAPGSERRRQVTRPRPGHADLAGSLKYDRQDARDILERASARETVARVACGAV